MSRPQSPPLPAGRHDSAARKRATAGGRRRGCFVYIAAEQLRAAGLPADGSPLYYRVWAAPDRPRFVVNLYTEA